jgi:hypothetical protein
MVEHRRLFPGVGHTAELEADLRGLKAKGLIDHFTFGAKELTVERSFQTGASVTEIFRGVQESDQRLEMSLELYEGILEALGELPDDHRALHPGNVLLTETGEVRLLDPRFNAVRFGRGNQVVGPWLWGPSLPKGWNGADWDHVSLVRLVALLAQGEEAWVEAWSKPKAAELARGWLDRVRRLLRPGDSLLETLPDAIRLVERIAFAEWEPVLDCLAWLERELAALPRTTQDGGLLSAETEARLVEQARSLAIEERDLRAELAVWCWRRRALREVEAETMVKSLLEAGRELPSTLVKGRVVEAAEAFFSQRGVEATAAQAKVAILLEREGLKDARRLEERARELLAARAAGDHWPSPQVRAEVAVALEAEGVEPVAVARRLVELATHRRWFSAKEEE